MREDMHVQKGIGHEFVTCECDKDEVDVHTVCCVPPRQHLGKIGSRWASGLTGFIAGAIVATIILLPWLFVLARLNELK